MSPPEELLSLPSASGDDWSPDEVAAYLAEHEVLERINESINDAVRTRAPQPLLHMAELLRRPRVSPAVLADAVPVAPSSSVGGSPPLSSAGWPLPRVWLEGGRLEDGAGEAHHTQQEAHHTQQARGSPPGGSSASAAAGASGPDAGAAASRPTSSTAAEGSPPEVPEVPEGSPPPEAPQPEAPQPEAPPREVPDMRPETDTRAREIVNAAPPHASDGAPVEAGPAGTLALAAPRGSEVHRENHREEHSEGHSRRSFASDSSGEALATERPGAGSGARAGGGGLAAPSLGGLAKPSQAEEGSAVGTARLQVPSVEALRCTLAAAAGVEEGELLADEIAAAAAEALFAQARQDRLEPKPPASTPRAPPPLLSWWQTTGRSNP